MQKSKRQSDKQRQPWVTALAGLEHVDGHASREAARRRFLDDATATLLGSVDFEANLRTVAAMAVPIWADACAIYLAEQDEPDRLRTFFVADRQDAHLRLDEAARQKTPQRHTDHPIFDAFDGCRSLGTNAIVDGSGEKRSDRIGHLTQLSQHGFRAGLFAPLIVRGRAVGVLALYQSESNRTFDEGDRQTLEILAARTATAIDNALLFRSAQDAVRIRDDFLSIASHELKTPLTSLQLQLDSLERGAERGEVERTRLVGGLALANRQTRRLTHLVETLLDVSRFVTGKLRLSLESFDLIEIVRSTIAICQEDRKEPAVPIVLHAPGSVEGRWDRLRMEQIVLNLLSNAVKYGEGKPIEVTIEATDDAVTLSVRDHGVGIAPENLERIFGRFERAASVRHYGGLGLGLFIARQVVEAHGGTISAHSVPYQGATFVVTLPRQTPDINVDNQSSDQSSAD